MDIFSMGDYGFFVWSSFLISFLVFLINYISAQRQFTSVLNEVKSHNENE
jgi:heme exporter protein CcmD